MRRISLLYCVEWIFASYRPNCCSAFAQVLLVQPFVEGSDVRGCRWRPPPVFFTVLEWQCSFMHLCHVRLTVKLATPLLQSRYATQHHGGIKIHPLSVRTYSGQAALTFFMFRSFGIIERRNFMSISGKGQTNITYCGDGNWS